MATLEGKRREVLAGGKIMSVDRHHATCFWISAASCSPTAGTGTAAGMRPQKFGLDLEDLNDRHKMSFDTYEEGKLNLDTYLNQVVFYKERPFTPGGLQGLHVRPVQAQSRR